MSVDRGDQSVASALLIEDDAAVAALLTELLQGLGLTVHHAVAAEPALALLATIHPTLIVTDLFVVARAGSSWDRVERLRQAAGSTPILVASGQAGAAAEGARRGFAVLVKPFDLEEFEAAVRGLIGDR